MPPRKTGQTPAAFLSYVHLDDKHLHISEFRQRLSDEVHVQTGEEFPIFQDRNDIFWGQNWKERIDDSIDGATFLVPIITPSFFNSPYCRREVERFLEREKQLRRSDLILPVYYVGTPLLDDGKRRAKDPVAEVIASHQYADWRDLRFEPFTSPQVGKLLAQLASQIRDALERGASPRKKHGTRSSVHTQEKNDRGGSEAAQASTVPEDTSKGTRIVSKTEPPTHVVDPMHRGDFTTISAAIIAAAPGDRILVRPGLYQEGIIIDKPLEIIGDGELGEAIVQAEGNSALLFRTTMGRVTNLIFRQLSGDWTAVNISQGRLELEGCDVSSQGFACIAIHGGADPRLRRNRIHDSKKVGVIIYNNGQGTLEDNDIFGNAYSGVQINETGNPVLRHNRIYDGKQAGVIVHSNGQGILEDNDIFSNALSGVEIKTGGDPVVRRNRIHDGKQGGVFVQENGRGTLEDNDIFGNGLSGVRIKTGGNPVLRRNRINGNKQSGVHVFQDGQGTFEENDISANSTAGVISTTGGNPLLRRNRINKNELEAVRISDGGAGTFEDNDMRENKRGAWDITDDCVANVTRRGNIE